MRKPSNGAQRANSYEPRGAALRLWHSKDPDCVIWGGVGCVTGDTRVYDHSTGTHVPIAQLVDEQRAPLVMTLQGPVQAGIPFQKGYAQTYTVITSGGLAISVIDSHLFLTPSGWVSIALGNLDLLTPVAVFPFLLPTSSESSQPVHVPDVHHCWRKVGDCQDGCRLVCSLCDGLLPRALDNDPSVPPSLSDVRGRNRDCPHGDDSQTEQVRNRLCPCDGHLSSRHCGHRTDSIDKGCCIFPSPYELWTGKHQDGGQSLCNLAVLPPIDECQQCADSMMNDVCCSCVACTDLIGFSTWDTVQEIIPGEVKPYFDLEVPGVEHYAAEGFVNHNTGKSRAALELLHFRAQTFPGFRGLMVRKTRSSMTQSSLVTWERDVCPGFKFTTNEQRSNRSSYKYPNGSEVVVGGLDKVENYMSSEFDMIVILECTEATEDDWTMLGTRLRSGVCGFYQIIGECNPSSANHWVKLRGDEGKVKMLESKHEDNPQLWDKKAKDWTAEGRRYLDDQRRRLTGFRLKRLLENQWVSPDGARFEFLERGVQTFDKRDIWPGGLPSTYDVIVGMDYGISTKSAFCALWIAIDHAGDYWVFREAYEPGLTAYAQAQMVCDLTGDNERVKNVFADSACWQSFPGHMGKTDLCVATYYERAFKADHRFGALVKGYKGPTVHPLATLDNLLQRDNGFPNLWIEEHCINLWRELTELVYDPRNENNYLGSMHAIDALYYALHRGDIRAAKTEVSDVIMPNEILYAHAKRQHEEAIKRFKRSHGRRV